MLVQKVGTKEVYAMKVIKKSMVHQRNQMQHTKQERDIMGKVYCPFIVEMHYAFQSPEKLYIVMDFQNGGELFYWLAKEMTFNEERIKFYMAELVLALEYLHGLGIIYRDLKPENVLLGSDGHLKITDFGLSKPGVFDQDGGKAFTFCGTAEYLAPEIIMGQGHSTEADWWSLGIISYEMAVGRAPFEGENKILVMRSIAEEKIDYQPLKKRSHDFQHLIRRLLVHNPKSRLGFNSANEIKTHPFFADIDWIKLSKKELHPPFIPKVRSTIDTCNIDEQFLNEMPVDSPANLQYEPVHFDQFTYARDKVIILKMDDELTE